MLVAEAGSSVAYFGIFDGHSNGLCSKYIASQMPARLKELKEPITEEALRELCIKLDTEFVTENDCGGSTGTFCIVRKDGAVTIANVGDSRILHCRKGKLLFATEDHKPSNPDERNRILNCGGAVLNNRVDGDLAVSRAFGDASFKVPNTKNYAQQKVVAIPDVTELQCEMGDLLILGCDGVFECSFSNEEVCQFVAEQLPKCWDDLAVAACRVCDEAIRRGSKDNISCMIVQLADGGAKVKVFGKQSFVPGPPFPRNQRPCHAAYSQMAEIGGFTTADALQQRYKLLQSYTKNQLQTLQPVMRTAFEMSDEVDIETEWRFFGKGPAPGNEKGFFEALANLGGQ